MAAATTGAIIAGAASLIGSGVNAYAQGKMNKRAERAMDKQRQWYLQDWEMQNQYNHPSQQMARLREAGLNPHLIYGGGQPTNTASGIQSTNINPYNPRTPDIGAMLTSPVNAYMEMRSFDAKQNLDYAELLKKLADVDTKNFDLSQKQLLADTQVAITREILAGKKIENVLNYDENIRRNLMSASSLTEAMYRMENIITDTDLKEMMAKKGNEEIRSIQQMRRKVDAEINNLIKDGTIKQFEIELNKAGFTKSDPVYFRLGKVVIDKVLGKDVTAEVAEIIKGAGEKAGSVKQIIKALGSKSFWLGGPFND